MRLGLELCCYRKTELVWISQSAVSLGSLIRLGTPPLERKPWPYFWHCSILKFVGSSPLPVVVFTDHSPLVFLSRVYNQSCRLMRWFLIIRDCNSDVRHKQGAESVMADALSRA